MLIEESSHAPPQLISPAVAPEADASVPCSGGHATPADPDLNPARDAFAADDPCALSTVLQVRLRLCLELKAVRYAEKKAARGTQDRATRTAWTAEDKFLCLEAIKLKVLAELQVRESQMTFADAVGRDMEPSAQEDFRHALLRGNHCENSAEDFLADEDDSVRGDDEAVMEEDTDTDSLSAHDGTDSDKDTEGDGCGIGSGIAGASGGIATAGKGSEASVKIHDGRLACSFINKRVTKFYNTRYLKGNFHGTVKSFEVKPQNKKFPVIFTVFFDEDQTTVTFNSGALVKILDEPI